MTNLLPPARDLAPMTELSATSEVREADPNKFDLEGRLRPIDQKRVSELAQSIRESTQLQPVLCRFKDKRLHLVCGGHRVEACKLLNRPVQYITISKTLIPEAEQEAFWTMMELDENLFRHELSTEDRKSMMAIRGRNLATINKVNEKINDGNSSTNGTGNSSTNGTGKQKRKSAAQWFTDWHGDGKVLAKQTAVNWWNQYRESIGQPKLRPGKANKAHQAAFFDYIEGQEAAAKEKAAQAEAESLAEERKAIGKKLDEIASTANGELAIQEWLETSKLSVFTERVVAA